VKSWIAGRLAFGLKNGTVESEEEDEDEEGNLDLWVLRSSDVVEFHFSAQLFPVLVGGPMYVHW